MQSRTTRHRTAWIALAVLLLTGCNLPGLEPTSSPAPEVPTPIPSQDDSAVGELTPIEAGECQSLADILAVALGIEVEISEAAFEDHLSDKTGMSCHVSAFGTGIDFPDQTWWDTTRALEAILPALGWQADIQYRADGPTGFTAGYRQDDRLCELSVVRKPEDMSLCAEDEAINSCWERLTPEKKIHTITLDCVEGISAPIAPEPQPASGIQPLSTAECENLAETLQVTTDLPVQISTVPFEDYIREEFGLGCMAAAYATGLEFSDEAWVDIFPVLENMLPAQGWVEDMQYSAAGATGFAYGYRRENQLCLLRFGSEPLNDELCPDDQPITVCWEDLAPEQKIRIIELNCAVDINVEVETEM